MNSRYAKLIVKDSSGNLVQLLPETMVANEVSDESNLPVSSAAVAEALSEYQGATVSANGTAGLVPAAAIAEKDNYLKGDGTWASLTLPADYVGATSGASGTHGLVPAATSAEKDSFLKGDGTWGEVEVSMMTSQEIDESWDEVFKECFKITVDTEAAIPGERVSGIPFNLYGHSGVTLTVNWGDGTTSTLTSADYTETNSSASTHEYATAGQYTITVDSNDWANTYIYRTGKYNSYSDVDSASGSSYFAETLTAVNKPLPKVKGMLLGSILKRQFSISNDLPTDNTLMCCFYNCSSLASVPSNLFTNNTTTTDFNYCFHGCSSLQSIPSGLFENNTIADSFSGCFSGCTSLASIPSGLFDSNVAVTSFSGCFYQCTSLQSIPSGLFDSNTAVTNFSLCFNYCSSLQSIPSGLFDKNTQVTTFYQCFTGCSSIQSIPSGLFDHNTAVTNFSHCFYQCTSIQSIPEGLFDSNTAVTDFQYCFYYCSSLQSIPSGLFIYNTAVTTFKGCFYGCSSLTDFTLHIGSGSVTDVLYFIYVKNNVTRIIYVPNNSTTYRYFSDSAAEYGLTVIGE